MKLSIAQIVKIPGGVQPFELRARWEELPQRDSSVSFEGEILVQGEARNMSEGVIDVQGSIQGVYCAQCSRCLKDVPVELTIDFEERFARTEDQDGEISLYEGETLDLDDVIQDNILLSLPSWVLCSENCRGLCPTCGADRNITHCSCREEETGEENHPLSKLKALLNDDEEV